MKTYNIIKVTPMREDVANGYDYFMLAINNSKGMRLTIEDKDGNTKNAPVHISRKFVMNLLKQESMPVESLTEREIHRLVQSLTIVGTIRKKEAGETFEADANTGLVTTDNGKTFVEAKKGQKYKVYADNYWIDYREPVDFLLDEVVANSIDSAVLARVSA
tara:strand:- start:58535 stop:59017 length:483 start_codon:yes stop_codon:yes gene_type:complete